jgi:chaperonin cofactor prefoldin
MISRQSVAGFVCLGCLAFGGLCLSQERDRKTRLASENETDSGKLEFRVRKLERQVKALTESLESLRKDVEPTATRPGRLKPL